MPPRAVVPQLVVWWFKMVVWVLQTIILEIKIELVWTSKPCLILSYGEITAEHSFSINSGSMNIDCGISAWYAHIHTHTRFKTSHIFPFLYVSHTHSLIDMQVIYDFIPKEWVVHELMWLLPLFLFPCREQRGVQETGAVDHVHRHGDQSSGDSVYGPLLPQQVREYKHKNIHINIHH